MTLFETTNGCAVDYSETSGYSVTLPNGDVMDFLTPEGVFDAVHNAAQYMEGETD
jgi:hypothetical protein